MATDAATLAILIDIRSRLDEITKAQNDMGRLKDETKEASTWADKLVASFRQGLGIGSGIEVARRAIDTITGSMSAAVRNAFQLATGIKDAAEALDSAAEPMQVLKLLVEDNGGQWEHLNQGVLNYRRV